MGKVVEPAACGASWSPVSFAHPGAHPASPAADPFHRPPTGYESTAPGTVLHTRPVDVAFMSRVRQRVAGWQLLYRTTDPQGAPEVTTTTVLVPGSYRRGRPLLGYQCAINSSQRLCFPSYSLLLGSRGPLSNPQIELLSMSGALRNGWALSVADHGGQPGRYGVGRQPGFHILDGLRAALSFSEWGFEPITPIGLWGYSGGGLSSGWAAEMAPEYAPELNIVGAALGSPAPEPGTTLNVINRRMLAGLAVAAVAALRSSYPALDAALRQHLSREGEMMLQSALTMSTNQVVSRYRRTDLGKYLDIPLSDFVNLPGIVAMHEDMRLGQRAPRCPIFVYSAIHDQLVGIDGVDRLVSSYTAGGTSVTYRKDRLSEHVSLGVLGAPAALHWLAEQFGDAEPTTAADQATFWSMLAIPGALDNLWGLLAGAARMLAGRALEPPRRPAGKRSKDTRILLCGARRASNWRMQSGPTNQPQDS